MSRVGLAPVPIPAGVAVTIEPGLVTSKGPKGMMVTPIHAEMEVAREADTLLVRRPSDHPRHRALHGLTRALLANAITGVSQGFIKVLELRGVGYRAEVQGRNLNLALGYSHPVVVPLPEAITAEVTPSTPTMENGLLAATIRLTCHDKQMLGDLAAGVRRKRPVEPYKGKGLRYQNEIVKRKLGKQSDKKK